MLGKYRNLVIILGAVAAVLLLGLFVYQTITFRITGTSPNNKAYPASLSTLAISFNKELDKSGLEKRLSEDVRGVVTIDFESNVRVTVKENELSLLFSRTPDIGDYSITLKDIVATDGKSLSATLPFNVKDIPYEKLSDEEKALFDAAARDFSDERDGDYPILEKLPHEAEQYKIDYTYDHGDPAPTIIITMKFFRPGNNAVPATAEEQQAYINDIRKYRTEALTWLRSQDPSYLDKYSLQYTELDAREEFPEGRGRYHNIETGDTHFEGDSHAH